MDFLDLLVQLLPIIITTLIGTVGFAGAVWVFINKASARIAKVSTAINIATQDKKLTGDEINDIIDSFSGDLDKAKDAIRSETIESV